MGLQKKILKGIGITIFAIAAMFAFGYVFMRLWNWLIPELFNGPIISFWQGVGLLALFKILFGSPRGGKGGCCKKRKRCCCGNCSCKASKAEEDSCSLDWKRKWKSLNAEEKEELKNKWKSRFNSCKDEHTNN